MPWGIKRPGDIISRPLPPRVANSPDPFDTNNVEYWEEPEIPPRSMTSSSLSTSHRPIKHGRGKHARVELVPQPSDDPDDPLNWPRWRKDLNLASLLIMVGLIGGMKTVFITTAGSLSIHYRVSHMAIGVLTAGPLLVSTLTSLVGSVAAKLYGKRPVYLGSTLFLFVGTIWNMTAGDDYGSCLGARLVQGIGWGAFETLVMGSIQDTYFEHERNLPVTIYNLLTITTTWGSPLLGGLASRNASSFTSQFRIINCFYILALPLLAFGAPETVFDRSRAATTPLPIPGLIAWRPWRLRHRLNKETALEHMKKMKPFSFKAPVTMPTLLQVPRAMIAPTTCLLSVLTCIPYGVLWGLTSSVSILTTPEPISLDAARTGLMMAGPWIIASLIVGGFCFYRGLYERFTKSVSYVIISTGVILSLTGVLSYGLGIYNFMAPDPSSYSPFFTSSTAGQISLPLLSLQLGILAGGTYTLDTITRPLLARSASFTSSSIGVAQRSIGDMHSGVIILRNLAAGIFVLTVPSAFTFYGGLKAAVIGLSITQVVLTGFSMALWWFFDETIWRADGMVMGLVDLKLLKQSLSCFDID
ncbi:Major facilitator superfamily domain, general substrate transporter [Metarhizium album ARSEF 1941]|uniref:Major facilitator superfamily domain, general substrate transporter n=1 Tax=Metarhizium album (strain ARSEF 1941) TaxID=1081103 RepID=A0A0B2WTP7_METAS|nr:Major facilitator superfamily domain, general substrate transporter [Metarhizium album ARSEF 1941]KHN97034.1 Major facilitator superfamily domain, general substrate transporter [Metarhizium album ARSEF 1941]